MGADGLEEAESAGGDDVSSVIGDLERNGDVRLGGEVVDLVGGEGVDPTAKRRRIGEVGVVELHAGLVGVVGVDVDVVDPLGVEIGGPSDQAVDVVAFVEEEFGEVGAVLAGDAGDERDLAGLQRIRGGAVGGGSGSGGVGLGRHCRVGFVRRNEREE